MYIASIISSLSQPELEAGDLLHLHLGDETTIRLAYYSLDFSLLLNFIHITAIFILACHITTQQARSWHTS